MRPYARVWQFLSAGRVSGIGQKRILPTKPKISRLITRRLIECRSFRALSARCLFSRSCRRSSASTISSSLLFFLPSPRHTSPHRTTSRADNFSLLGFPAVASPSLLSCRTATLPGSPSSSLAIYSVGPSSALMRTSFSNYVLLPPPLLILLLLILRFLLHLLLVLVSFIFMQW